MEAFTDKVETRISELAPQDASTVSLITSGPELAGVNLEELPKEFTSARGDSRGAVAA